MSPARAKKAKAPAVDTGLTAAWASYAAPPPDLTVSEWAEATRVLPESSASRGAKWRNASAPYLAGIMDAMHEPGARVISLMKGSQLGGSEALHNIIGYHIEHDPCPMLMVHPTEGQAEEWSKDRLSDLIRSTPAIADAVQEKRQTRQARSAHATDGSTLQMKIFPGGYLVVGGANTPNTFARRSVRRAFGDDVDRFPPVVGEEGHPADLLMNRLETFVDGCGFFVSTPTLKNGLIDKLYQDSDRRRYFVPCLTCGFEDYITWSDPTHFSVTFDDRDPETARIVCPACGGAHYEPERRKMIALGPEIEPAGKGWRPTELPVQAGNIGFQLPTTLSLLGVTTLPYLVEQWLAAREKGKESLRVFINTKLAEGWEDRGAKRDPQGLYARRESYGEGVEVPAGAPCLTAGVDTQDDRFELTVYGWGLAEERWVVDHVVIPGDTKREETHAQLLEALRRRYTHASGHLLPIHATCIDSGGHSTDAVYQFVLRYQHMRLFATKGYGGKSGEPIVGKPSKKTYGKNPRPVLLYPINVDDAKGNIMSALAQETPGPSYVHFPIHERVNEEFFAQLCSEEKRTVYNRNNVATHVVWVETRERNEALDTAVLAFAAYRLLNPNIRQLAEVLASTPVARVQAPSGTDDGGGTPPPAPAPPKPPQRRFSRSSYLQR